MYIARLLYPVKVLGPGDRIGIWFCGCPRRCQGCSNPELWEFQERYKTKLNSLMDMVKQITDKHNVDGFTITGGEPLYQSQKLYELLEAVTSISEDTLVYTGYKKEELSSKQLKNIAVLIDGQYIENRNNGSILRGSDNQRIFILNEKFRTIYEHYIKTTKNQVQNFMVNDKYVSVGIHKRGFVF